MPKQETSLSIYNRESYDLAWRITKHYSTSFSLGIRLFDRDLRPHIAAIYALVRIADEIVDSWDSVDQRVELDAFEKDCYEAIKSGFSTNPVLQSFQLTCNTYHIEKELITAFFHSMRLDLDKTTYDEIGYQEYIYGSAEVVGLMCLAVFTLGDRNQYEALRPGAQALGSAFQKVNFLRDVGADQEGLGRVYFPGVEMDRMSEQDKSKIQDDITTDFKAAKVAIDHLPNSSRWGVTLAYTYYLELLDRISAVPAKQLAVERIRVGDGRKLLLLVSCLWHRFSAKF